MAQDILAQGEAILAQGMAILAQGVAIVTQGVAKLAQGVAIRISNADPSKGRETARQHQHFAL